MAPDLLMEPPKIRLQMVRPVETSTCSPMGEVFDVAAEGLGHPTKLGDDLGFDLEEGKHMMCPSKEREVAHKKIQ